MVKHAIPLSTMLFCFETLLGLVSQNRISSATGLKQSVDSKEFADYELEKDNYEFLTNFIKSKYSDIYNKIKEQEKSARGY